MSNCKTEDIGGLRRGKGLKSGTLRNLGALQICICTTLYMILFDLDVKKFYLKIKNLLKLITIYTRKVFQFVRKFNFISLSAKAYRSWLTSKTFLYKKVIANL